MESSSVEMNIHSWQGLAADTYDHKIRYLDQRSAQNPKCIVLSPKHVDTPARRNSGLVLRHGLPETTAVHHFFEISDEIRRDPLSSCEIII